jgi:hypothetical protein
MLVRSGAWYSFGPDVDVCDIQNFAQGREKAKAFLEQHEPVCDALELAVRAHIKNPGAEREAGDDANEANLPVAAAENSSTVSLETF